MSCKGLPLFILIILTFTIFTAGCVDSDDTRTYVVGVSPGYPPFIFTDEDGNLKGIDVDSILWIAEEEGFDVRFEIIEEWDSLIPSLLAGKIDMIYSGMTSTEERAKYITFSDPYYSVSYTVTVKDDSEWTFDDFLSGRMKIAVTSGSTTESWLEEYYTENYPGTGIVRYQRIDDALLGVINGDADGCLGDSSNLLYIMGYTPDLSLIGSMDSGLHYGVGMRNEHTELHDKINGGLAKLISSGKWDEIASSYNFNP